MINSSEVFPDNLRRIYDEWKSGKFPNGVKREKTYVIPYSDQQSKGDRNFGFILISPAICCTVFILLLAIPFNLLLLLILPVLWLFLGPFAFSRFVFNYRQNLMKKEGYIVISPSGVLYHYSNRKYGYFTWKSIELIKEGQNIGFTHDGRYIKCQLRPHTQRRKYTHLIRYDNIDSSEIGSSKKLLSMFDTYWKFYKDKTDKNSKLPSIYIIDNLLGVMMTFGLLAFIVGIIFLRLFS